MSESLKQIFYVCKSTGEIKGPLEFFQHYAFKIYRIHSCFEARNKFLNMYERLLQSEEYERLLQSFFVFQREKIINF